METRSSKFGTDQDSNIVIVKMASADSEEDAADCKPVISVDTKNISSSSQQLLQPATQAVMDMDTSNEANVNQNVSDHFNHQAVLLLIDLYRSRRHLLRDPGIKKIELWDIITEDMIHKGYSFTVSAVNKKFCNLKNRYRLIKYSDNSNQRSSRWPYYDLMEDILHDEELGLQPKQNATKHYSLRNGEGDAPEEQSEDDAEATPERAASPTPATTASPAHATSPSPSSSRLEGVSSGDKSVRKSRKRKRESEPEPDPPQWFKDFQEKNLKTLSELVQATKERNNLLKQLLNKLS